MPIKHSVLTTAVALAALSGALVTTQAQASGPVSPLAVSPTVSPEPEKVFHTTDGLSSCPSGRFCTETWDEVKKSWKIHVFWKCGTYKLSNWEKVGAYINNQDGAYAKVLNADKKLVWPEIPPNNKKGWGNWSDAWYIRPC
ncbi:hypothetical protein [Streptomyces sp. KL118A]|uniref:hypothetical protein n=1 Tax=Streptomyces sp. KL118A TaxID=3045153 RepID=UPI00278C4F16|nr:hypothetical protein [Streptomyces sp. KL118A]